MTAADLDSRAAETMEKMKALAVGKDGLIVGKFTITRETETTFKFILESGRDVTGSITGIASLVTLQNGEL